MAQLRTGDDRKTEFLSYESSAEVLSRLAHSPYRTVFSEALSTLAANAVAQQHGPERRAFLQQLHSWLVEAQKAPTAQQHHLSRVQNLRVLPFGSFVMGTSDRVSDLDVTLEGEISDPDISVTGRLSEAKRDFKVALLTEIHNLLIRGRHLYPWRGTRLIRDARVAISRFRENLTGNPCDLSIGNTIGVFKSRLLATVLEIDERLRDLVIIVKNWAKAHGFDDACNGYFNSYCLMLLVLTFAQTRSPPLLPPLQEIFPGLRPVVARSRADAHVDLIQEVPRFQQMAKEWMAEKERPQNKESLSDLLFAFFLQLSMFATHSQQIQTTRKGEHIMTPRPTSSCWEGGYMFSCWDQETTYRSMLFVEDPFDAEDNCARALKCHSWFGIVTTLRETAYFIQIFSSASPPSHSSLWRDLWTLFFSKTSLRQLPGFNSLQWHRLQWMHSRGGIPVSIIYHHPLTPVVYANGQPCIWTTYQRYPSASIPHLTMTDGKGRGGQCESLPNRPSNSRRMPTLPQHREEMHSGPMSNE